MIDKNKLSSDFKLENVCRLCLNSDRELTDIFNDKDLTVTGLAFQICVIGSLRVLKNDGFPSLICNICRRRVNDAYDLRQQILNTYSFLQQYIKINGFKINNRELKLVCVDANKTETFTLKNIKLISLKNKAVLNDDSCCETVIKTTIPVKDINENLDICDFVEKLAQQDVTLYSKNDSKIKIKSNNSPDSKTENEKNYASDNNCDNDCCADDSFEVDDKAENNKCQKTVRNNTLNKLILSCQLCLKTFNDLDRLKKHVGEHFDGFSPSGPLPEELSDEENNDRETSKSYKIINNSNNILQCHVCGVKFVTYLDLLTHLRTLHYNGAYYCQPCKKKFDTHNFVVHQRRHLGIKPFVCKTCGKGFLKPTERKDHEFRHLVNKPFLCGSCGKSYITHSRLKQHEAEHNTNSSKITCDVCNKTFKNNLSYRLHMKRHESDSVCICSICGREFYSKTELQRHELKHMGVKKHLCKLCDYKFYSKTELRRHLNYHSGEKKYLCKECGKAFFESGYLRIHERIHAGIKPYNCQVCSKSFVTKSKLQRHMQTHLRKAAKSGIV